MSRIQDAIAATYPSLAQFSADGSSDSQIMMELASDVVDRFAAGNAAAVSPAFALAEQLIAGGSEGEKRAAIVGFLETVQNVASHRPFGAAAFEQFLGPNSKIAWNEIKEIWRGKSSLAEVVAAETGASLGPRWWQFWRRRRRKSPRELLSEVHDPELRKIIEQITRE